MNAINIATIGVTELKKRRDQDPELCLIDVREKDEWQALHIPGAHLIPKNDITQQIKAIAPKLDQTIYLHCKSGMRSQYAAACLLAMGYTNVYSVDGGIMEWSMLGYPVEEGCI